MKLRYTCLLLVITTCNAGERPSAANPQCDEGNGGITLPAGFCAAVFADEIGVARHLVGVAEGPDGSLYISDDQRGRIWRVVYAGEK